MNPTITLTEPILLKKWNDLIQRIKLFDSAVVAFSGGVDSSFLAVVTHMVLSPKMLAVTIQSQVETHGIMATAQSLAGQFGFPHQIIPYDKLKDDAYVENSSNRCYVCKSTDLGIISEIAKKTGIDHVLMGANSDDLKDYRPGLRAAHELGVLSPLAEVGLTKKEIRLLSRELGLSNWNHPSSPCLASRLPYGVQVTREKLEQVALGEAYLRALGFMVVRVRNNGHTARIEVEQQDLIRIIKLHDIIVDYFKQIGFQYVTIDLEGFRSGSLNEVLPETVRAETLTG